MKAIHCTNWKCLLSAVTGLFLVLTLPSAAAPVTYWFTGQAERFYNPSNIAPSGVSLGTPFVGRISYDPANVFYAVTNNSSGGVSAQYIFGNTVALSITLYMAGHTISNVANSGVAGDVGVENNVSGRDFYYVESSSALKIDGANMVSLQNQVGITLSFTDENSTALSSIALPLSAPVPAQFSEGGFMYLNARNGNGTVDLLRVGGPVSVISTNEIVLLSYRRASSSTIQLAWPLYANGYTLQSTANLTAPNWQNVSTAVVNTATEHTVVVPSTGAPKFFRLKK